MLYANKISAAIYSQSLRQPSLKVWARIDDPIRKKAYSCARHPIHVKVHSPFDQVERQVNLEVWDMIKNTQYANRP